MNIASFGCTKNEEDIIETFVRVNSRFINRFVFFDDSTDSTRSILQGLISEGFKITVLDQKYEGDWKQDSFVNLALQQLVEEGNAFDFYCPLDADEFITFNSRNDFADELNKIPKGHVGSYRWKTFIPISADFNSYKSNGLQLCFRPREIDANLFEKTIIPKDVAAETRLSTGAHIAFNKSGESVATYNLSMPLAHFPVRSSMQIILKNLNWISTVLRVKLKVPGDNYHHFQTLKLLHDNDFQVDLAGLQKMAFLYANDTSSQVSYGDCFPYNFPDYQLLYTDISDSKQNQRLAKIIVDYWKDQPDLKELAHLKQVLGVETASAEAEPPIPSAKPVSTEPIIQVAQPLPKRRFSDFWQFLRPSGGG